MFIVEGRIYYCEVKKRGGKPSPEQIARHEERRAFGAVVFVADSIESFIGAFNEYFRNWQCRFVSGAGLD